MFTTSISQPTRDRILTAVLELLSQGKAHLPMSQIAAQTGVSKAALYYFFPGKKALFQSVITAIFGRLLQDLETLGMAHLSAEKKLRQMITTCLERAKSESTMTNFIFREVFENDPLTLEEIFLLREKAVDLFAAVLAQGVEERSFATSDPHQTAAVLMGLLDFSALSAAFSHKNIRQGYPSAELLEHFLSLITIS